MEANGGQHWMIVMAIDMEDAMMEVASSDNREGKGMKENGRS